eukprot:430555-Pleurochrysis_carterae.AAC.2
MQKDGCRQTVSQSNLVQTSCGSMDKRWSNDAQIIKCIAHFLGDVINSCQNVLFGKLGCDERFLRRLRFSTCPCIWLQTNLLNGHGPELSRSSVKKFEMEAL